MRFFFYEYNEEIIHTTKQIVLWGLGILSCWLLLQLIMQYFLINTDSKVQKKNPHSFNISRAFVISMNQLKSQSLIDDIKTYMDIYPTTIFQAINGTEALQNNHHELSLYTKYTMLVGRHDHMQIANPSALGCLLSHIAIWKMVSPGEVIAIFEEDAFFDHSSTRRLSTLSKDMQHYPWDILMLINGQFIASGKWKTIGKGAATCMFNTTFTSSYFHSAEPFQICTWFGTRGYFISHNGAKNLLKHAKPIQIQIDALIGLVAAFEPGFKMYWTRDNIVHQNIFYVSQIWDACLKCYLPTDLWFYFIFCIFFLCFLLYTVFKLKRHFNPQ